MTAPDHATLRAFAIRSHLIASAFNEAYHAKLLDNDDARAADRYGAGMAGLRRLVEFVAEGKQDAAWADSDEWEAPY